MVDFAKLGNLLGGEVKARKHRFVFGFEAFQLIADLARLGGEEFGVLFNGLDVPAANVFCETLRAEIAEVGQPLWKRAGYIASLSPILLAALAFGLGGRDAAARQLDRLQAKAETRPHEGDHRL